jgi:ABC-2 type transport system ATP-binding protein/lipopolysaccharide transport system ATP-binding protein
MRTFIGEAGLLVLASHSDDLIRQWCTSAIWMEHGRMRLQGGVEEVLAAYHGSLAA